MLIRWGLAALEVLAVYQFGYQAGWWWLAVLVVLLVELQDMRPGAALGAQGRLGVFWMRLPGLVVGLSAITIIALVPRGATQVVVAALYAIWLAWREREGVEATPKLAELLVLQAVMFEAIFLVAAIWQTPSGDTMPAWIILALVWAGAYLTVYGALKRRGDRSAGVMAATWGVVATEVSWILMLWLITYTMHGGYVLVPQPALILTALAYIFGSVLTASRQGNLSRARLGEYMVIALILVIIVVAGTSWHGNV